MTTTGTRRSLAMPWVLSLVLLAAALLGGLGASPVLADPPDSEGASASTPVLAPEPATLLFAGVAGLGLFRRRREWRRR